MSESWSTGAAGEQVRELAAPAATFARSSRGLGAGEETVLGRSAREPSFLPQAPAAAPRTSGGILAARTLGELRDVLATILGGLYSPGIRFELFLGDDVRTLAAATGGTRRTRLGHELLATLRSCLLVSRRQLGRLHLLPASSDLRRGALMTAPLLDASEALVGLLVVESALGERGFTDRDGLVLEGVAALVSVALQRLRAGGHEPARARIELDRKAACRVQRRLMSGSLPAGVGVTAHTGYLPAFDVGGDFYCLKDLGDRRVGVAIGDVSGNGVAAALVMSRVASDIERALAAGSAPSSVLREVNDRLAASEGETFVTASCLRLDTGRRRARIANAGHLPLVVRRADGEVFTCGGASGTPLGMLPCDYDEEELPLRPKDILLLMTDGLLEALDHPSGGLGMKTLLGLVRDAPHDPRLIDARIRHAVERARARHVLDDVTWVGLQLAG